MADLRLSVLDQSVSLAGGSEDAAIRDTLDLAQHCERLGYARFWLSEHHGLPTIVGSAPEILMAAIAARTSTIRIGSAGVMLPHYSALKVAEQFKVAEAIAPGRIDLGLGRAPGSDGRTAFALNPRANEAADNFPNQVMDLLGWLGEGLPEGHTFRAVAANPQVPGRPQVWMLGSSDYGAQVAAYFGLPYCYAHFISDRGSEQVTALYREAFRPQPGIPGRLAAPHAALGVFALTADTEAEAWRLYRDTGRFPPLPSVEEAEAYPFTEAERAHLAPIRAKALVGAPEQVRAKLEALAAAHGVQEVAVLTPCHDPAARQRSYQLLAEAFGLGGQTLAAAAE